MSHSPLVEAVCSKVGEYAMASALQGGFRPPYKALLVVAGNGDFLAEHTFPVTRKVGEQAFLDAYLGCSVDDDRIYDAFDAMNPLVEETGHRRVRHRDGAIIIDGRGEIAGMGMRLNYPEYGTEILRAAEEMIMELKGSDEVGIRHATALRMSKYPLVDVAAAVSECKGTMIPFRNGMIIRDRVFVPHRPGAMVVVPEYRAKGPDSSPADGAGVPVAASASASD